MPHTVVGRIRIGADTIMVSCLACKVVYYRADNVSPQQNCVICSGKMEILAGNTKGD